MQSIACPLILILLLLLTLLLLLILIFLLLLLLLFLMLMIRRIIVMLTMVVMMRTGGARTLQSQRALATEMLASLTFRRYLPPRWPFAQCKVALGTLVEDRCGRSGPRFHPLRTNAVSK